MALIHFITTQTVSVCFLNSLHHNTVVVCFLNSLHHNTVVVCFHHNTVVVCLHHNTVVVCLHHNTVVVCFHHNTVVVCLHHNTVVVCLHHNTVVVCFLYVSNEELQLIFILLLNIVLLCLQSAWIDPKVHYVLVVILVYTGISNVHVHHLTS